MAINFTNFSYESNYADVKGYKIHYIESGYGKPILFIHGNPTSCYVWRNILIDVASSTGRQAIALDLLGFGLSEKPNKSYTVDLHYTIIREFIKNLDLKDLIIVAHDWGGPLGVMYGINHIENLERILVLDTFLWNLTWDDFPKNVTIPFKIMRSPLGYILVQLMNGFVKRFVPQNILNKDRVTAELMENYKRPFPTVASRRAILAFPRMIPVEGKPETSFIFFKYIEDNIRKINIPFKMLIAKPGMGEVNMYKVEHMTSIMPKFSYNYFEPSGHYMQEDNPEGLAKLIASFINS